MKRATWSTKAACVLLILALLAPAFSVGAFALSKMDPMLYADLDKAEFEFTYTPPANSDYALYLFSQNGGEVQAYAELIEDGEVIASGEGSGRLFSEWLVSSAVYTIRVHGSGKALIEVARDTLSRSFGQPLELEDGKSRGKMIASSYDAHWHAFTAEKTAPMVISCAPEDPNLRLSAMLFDENGVLLSRFDSIDGGACLLRTQTQAGKKYFIRVFSSYGDEGYYTLRLSRTSTQNTAPSFLARSIGISEGSSLNLAAQASGEIVLWTTSNSEIVRIEQNGTIHGLKEGVAYITAYGLTGAARCAVSVEYVPLEDLEILGETIRLSVGDDTAIQLDFTPENSSNQRIQFSVEDPDIIEVSRDGVVTALAEGETTLHVSSEDGRIADSIDIEVSPAVKKYRALLVSQQNYPESINSVRKGSENSVNALESLLGTVRFENAAYVTRSLYDVSRAELIYEIRETFAGASEQDVSLIYISSHGYYSGGMSFLELCDGSILSARDLERELRNIPGTIILMVDCCGSGGMIGESSATSEFAEGITSAFASASVSGSKYKVLCSAGLDEDSYRIAFNENADAGIMATVFARALCDGAGWNIDLDRRGTMSADQNYDGSITLNELYMYMFGRVNWYLELASDMTGKQYRQSIQVYPEGDPFILFERNTSN